MEIEEATIKLKKLIRKADKLGIPRYRIRTKLESLRGVPPQRKRSTALCSFLVGILSVTAIFAYTTGFFTHDGFSQTWFKWHNINIHYDKCTINMPPFVTRALRPPEDCSFCRNVTKVDRRCKLSPTEFESRYAYSGRPVIVKDAVQQWTAHKVFSFDFFKKLYQYSTVQDTCQFFPYKTEFRYLREVFNMSKDRALMRDGTQPWYVGWCNCDNTAGRILREHYKKPYFLPLYAESANKDWIFMGSPGYGAQMHVDNVNLPSWQAQLSGKKKWSLQPPPECIYECQDIEVVVNQGEIIVLDTNRWYHATLIVSDNISITIGAEFD